MTFYSCKEEVKTQIISTSTVQNKIQYKIVQDGSTIKSRFSPPIEFERISQASGSFGHYLRNFPLLNIEEEVHLFDGTLKSNQSVHASILDIDVGSRDLQQCADAVMRLRAEYLLKEGRPNEIAFDFTNGWKFEYSRWKKGDILNVNGNSTKWISGSEPRSNYSDFRKYLDKVFMYAGTLSLSKEMKAKDLKDIEIGDVFIVGGSPGHAVIVVDIAANKKTGEKAFMIAQSYMPAQQIHILKNLNNESISPWYLTSEIDSKLYTPEWTFDKSELMEF